MKAYESANAVALRKRVRKVHSKARWAGVLYLLGALALMALAFFPMITIDGTEFGVQTFWQPFIDLASGTFAWVGIIVGVLYAILLLKVVINFFRCFSKLGWLSKRSSRYVNGYNRNARAMSEMGKRFAGSFAAIINITLFTWIMQASTAEVALTMYAYVTLAIGLGVHFIAGLIGGTVSYFDVQGNSGSVQEVKRECGLFVYFFRNLVQVAAVAGIVWFFLPENVIGDTVAAFAGGANPFATDLLKSAIPFAVQLLLTFFLFALVDHAVDSTEFNRQGNDGAGMKKYPTCVFFVFLLAAAAVGAEYVLINPGALLMPYIYIAAIAFVTFLILCIFKSRKAKKEKVEEEEEFEPVMSVPTQAQPQPMSATKTIYQQLPCPAQVCPPQQPSVVYQQVPVQQPVMYPQPVYQQQPVYIPIYYPFPQPVAAPAPAPAPAPVVEKKVEEKPAPKAAPVEVVPVKAPERIKPAPAPVVEKKEEKKVEKQEQQEGTVEVKALNPNKDYKIRCPRCGKVLNVRDTSPYHRCPNCDKVFSIRKFQTYVRK